MSFKDILAPLLSVGSDGAALAAAESVAAMAGGRVAVVMLELQPDPIATFEAGSTGMFISDYLDRLQKQYDEDKARLLADAKAAGKSLDVRELLVTPSQVDASVGVEARGWDLVVMLMRGEAWQQYTRRAALEGALFGSGRPLLLVPPEWRGATMGKRVLVAWNGKREAARALADAEPFLEGAEKISIVTVDDLDDLALSAARAAEHLARRGLKAEAHELKRGDGDAETLLEAAAAMKADLIVMGGYGRARLSEMVFGGVTRALIQASPIPLFMSH